MAKDVQRFFLVFVAIVSLIVMPYHATAQDQLDQQFMAEATRQLGYASNPDDQDSQTKAYNLILSALEQYQMGNYDASIKLLDQAIALTNSSKELISLRQSLARLQAIREADDGLATKEKPVKLDWDSTGERFSDKNRFLFRAVFNLDFNTMIFADQSPARLALSGSLEGFLPHKERIFGLYAGVSSQFFNIDAGAVAKDYDVWEYQFAFQWRLGWNLPGLEQRVTLALRFGVTAQHVKQMIADSFPYPSLAYYVLPSFELYLQDAILSHIWMNTFTENLFFAPFLSLAWLPIGRTPTTLFNTGIAINYRFGPFSIGPSYHFRYQYNLKSNQSARYSIWALMLSYQYS